MTGRSRVFTVVWTKQSGKKGSASAASISLPRPKILCRWRSWNPAGSLSFPFLWFFFFLFICLVFFVWTIYQNNSAPLLTQEHYAFHRLRPKHFQSTEKSAEWKFDSSQRVSAWADIFMQAAGQIIIKILWKRCMYKLQFVPNMSTRHPRTWSPTSSSCMYKRMARKTVYDKKIKVNIQKASFPPTIFPPRWPVRWWN